jgi:hypothetical protein
MGPFYYKITQNPTKRRQSVVVTTRELVLENDFDENTYLEIYVNLGTPKELVEGEVWVLQTFRLEDSMKVLSERTIKELNFSDDYFLRKSLKFIPYVNRALQRKVIYYNYEVIQYFQKPPSELCIIAINRDAEAIRYIKNGKDEIYKHALSKRPLLIGVIENPSEEVQKYAIGLNSASFKLIKNPSVDTCITALYHDPNLFMFIDNQTEELCKIALCRNGMLLKFVKEQTEDLCEVAVMNQGLGLQYVKKQTPKLCKLAINQNPHAYYHIHEKTWPLFIYYIYRSTCCFCC